MSRPRRAALFSIALPSLAPSWTEIKRPRSMSWGFGAPFHAPPTLSPFRTEV